MQGYLRRTATALVLTVLLCVIGLLGYPGAARAAGSNWSIQNSTLTANGGFAGLLGFGYAWTDYTMTFQTAITTNQAGWLVRGQAATNNYLLILDADNDTVGTPNVLQQVVGTGNNSYAFLPTVPLPFDLKPNTWHTVKTVVQGTTVTTSVDGQQIAATNFTVGATSYATGTVGFREGNGETAQFQSLQITDPNHVTLYQNALNQATSLTDFNVPGSGVTALPWPTNPSWWQQYVQAPATRDVHPIAVVSTSGNVTNATGLTVSGSGTTTLTYSGSGTAPTILLDYGKDVGGLPEFMVTATTGAPKLRAQYSEGQQYFSGGCGDCAGPWGSIGDAQRYDEYTLSQTGTITGTAVQGGERFQMLTLETAGSITLSGIEIYYEPFLGTPTTFKGNFVSDDPTLNRVWYDGAYTVNLDQLPPGTPSGDWSVQNGALTASGGFAGLLTTGSSWTDYTMTFQTAITTNQAGWLVRGQSASNNYLLILNADNDTTGTPNSLQQVIGTGPNSYTSLAATSLPFDLKPNTWHTVKTVVKGTLVTTFVDSQQIASFNSTSFPAGTPSYATGTVGFREGGGEAAQFQNLQVSDANNATLYQNALNQSSALADFTVPGSNALPLVLDGAKRDRAVWEGDFNIAGPTLYYSSDATDYMKDSLLLLGSYQHGSGFVEGDKDPAAPLNTTPLGGDVGTYSASYSIYYVLNLADYYLYTGDQSFINQEWPVVQNELAWSAQKVNAQGLFVTDTSDGLDWHYYDGNLTGVVTEYNLLYYQTLLDGAALATATGHSSLATTYQQQAAALKTAINGNLFNSAQGIYNISTTNSSGVAQDANALAVLYGVAPSSVVPGILASLKQNLATTYGPLSFSSATGFKQYISPFASAYDVWARLQANDTPNALSEIATEWGHITAPGQDATGTMWEVEGTDGTPGFGAYTSLAHGWSTGPTTALSKYVLGISPVTAGYKTWLVEPHPGSLPWAQGQAPTPAGTLAVAWGQSANQPFTLQVQSPANTTGTIAVPTFGRASVTIHVNGKVVWSNGSFQATTGITGAATDGTYVYLSATGGQSLLVLDQ